MLNFDSSHKTIDGNINERKSGKRLLSVLLAGLISVNLMLFSGCTYHEEPCNIEKTHVHIYVEEDGWVCYQRCLSAEPYLNSSKYVGLTKKDDYFVLEGSHDINWWFFNNYAYEHGLYRIDENKELIDSISSELQDHTEYRYTYDKSYTIMVPHIIGKVPVVTTQRHHDKRYSWTTDTTKELTGETREVHYVYYGYKIESDNDGVHIIQSEPVDDLSLLPEGYDFVKKDFYKAVNPYDYNEVYDYEDGPELSLDDLYTEEYNKSLSM